MNFVNGELVLDCLFYRANLNKLLWFSLERSEKVQHINVFQGYKEIYEHKKVELNEQANRMKMGLEKLQEAGRSVAALSEELAVKEQELDVANRRAEKILAEVYVVIFARFRNVTQLYSI